VLVVTGLQRAGNAGTEAKFAANRLAQVRALGETGDTIDDWCGTSSGSGSSSASFDFFSSSSFPRVQVVDREAKVDDSTGHQSLEGKREEHQRITAIKQTQRVMLHVPKPSLDSWAGSATSVVTHDALRDGCCAAFTTDS
jgi:hypothetical protein